tara:strand:+ start:2745 stop:3248 length:504 start_codon:yes stop_codon:yes gene_type:complete
MKQQPSLCRMRSRYRRSATSRAKASPGPGYGARSWPVVFAAMLALRALVPVGYMLSLPGDGSIDWALHLCPVQNRTLDVSALQSLAAGDHHGHADPGDPGAAGERTRLAVSGDCTVWLDSATPALAASLALPDRTRLTTAPFADPNLPVAGRLCRHPGQARAPPVTV